jgi:hypothetical protein
MKSSSHLEKTTIADSFITKPLSEWCVVNPISTPQEMEVYKSTWDPLKTLKENQELLTQRFAATCCQHSLSSFRKTLPDNEGRSITLVGSEKFNDTIMEAVFAIAQNPVGSKLMRILISKFDGTNVKPTKLVFTIVESPKDLSSSFSLSTPSLLLLNFSDNKKFLWMSSSLVPEMKSFSLDETIFSGMLHWYHAIEGKFSEYNRCQQTIINRTVAAFIKENFLELDRQSFTDIFGNDEEYRTILGITTDSSGKLCIDTLSEAAYLYTKNNGIRCCHRAPKKSTSDSDYATDIVYAFSEHGIHHHYLNGKVKLPHFGIGQYQCSDLDSATGAKKYN